MTKTLGISCFCDLTHNLNRFICCTAKENYDLKVTDVILLNYLSKHPSSSMITLARFLDIPPSTMTSLIDNLHKRQLVKRKYSENNRREVIVEATSKAEKIIVEFNKLIHAKFSKTLSQTESITLAKLINKFNQPFL